MTRQAQGWINHLTPPLQTYTTIKRALFAETALKAAVSAENTALSGVLTMPILQGGANGRQINAPRPWYALFVQPQ